MRTTAFIAALLLLATPLLAQAGPDPVTRTVEYTHDGRACKGYLAMPGGVTTAVLKPGILVVPEWWGLNEFAKDQAEDLARQGYIAFAVDVYGDGKVTDDPKQAGEWAGKFYGDRQLFRDRLMAGLKVLKDLPQTDDGRLAAIGFCFGGTAVCELALAGAPIKAAVSFHGNPRPPMDGDLDRLSAFIAIHHGDADSFVPDDKLEAFLNPLREAEKEFILIRYANAVHSFTNPASDERGMDGVKYDPMAAKLAFASMHDLFRAVFYGSEK